MPSAPPGKSSRRNGRIARDPATDSPRSGGQPGAWWGFPEALGAAPRTASGGDLGRPVWARSSRPRARARLGARFDAGSPGRRRWQGIQTFGHVNAEIGAATGPVRRRASYYARNNLWIANGVNALVTGGVHPKESTDARLRRCNRKRLRPQRLVDFCWPIIGQSNTMIDCSTHSGVPAAIFGVEPFRSGISSSMNGGCVVPRRLA